MKSYLAIQVSYKGSSCEVNTDVRKEVEPLIQRDDARLFLESPEHQVDPIGNERLVPLERGRVEPADPRAPPTEMFLRVLDGDEGERFDLEEASDEVYA